ncbi:MAG: hypothetical protein GX772_10055, partial [Alcaligenaceae bacterium]|nr:hypothetical protein [Alcaligenaceae bacterium]
MKTPVITLAITAAFAGPAHAESYRLAYSNAEQIEIFVEHAAGTAWCAPHLNMRVIYKGEPNPSGLATLMPKLGGLLTQQCPQATDITWKSETAQGALHAGGTASKAGLWAIVPDNAAVVAEAAAEAAPAPVAAAAETAPAPAAPVAAAPEAAPAAAAPVAAAPEAAPA